MEPYRDLIDPLLAAEPERAGHDPDARARLKLAAAARDPQRLTEFLNDPGGNESTRPVALSLLCGYGRMAATRKPM